MAKIEMVMPKMGESVMEGTILTWLKGVGEEIEQDESVLEVATDKVDTEVPATHSGKLVEILAQEGDVVQVGAPIAIIETDVEEVTSSVPSDAPVEDKQQENQENKEAVKEEEKAEPVLESSRSREPVLALNGGNHSNDDATTTATRFYSPLVMSIAKEEGISMGELESLEGSGSEGRVTKRDIFAYLQDRQSKPTNGKSNGSAAAKTQVNTPAQQPQPSSNKVTPVSPAKSYGANEEVIEMDRMRKMIAQRMVESVQTSPHVTSFVEVDVTNLFNWRNKWKRVVKERDGVALTFTPIFIEAVAKAIQDFPKINCSVDGDKIILKKNINVGMAVALPNDNLIVPVIHNTNELNLLGITKKVSELVNKARNNKLSPDDLSGGTYTMSNIGSFGNMLGTPIIMQPQVAILSVGAVIKKPAVVETAQGDMIGIRHMMYLSHSYDHRVVDGALGGKFVRRVADYLENFDVNREI